MERLLELVYDYSVNNKIADEDFIFKACDVIIDYKHLDTYIYTLDFNRSPIQDKKKLRLGIYNPLSKMVRFYLSEIDYYLGYIYRHYGHLFNYGESVFLKNLTVLQVLLHETEHADHQKVFDVSALSTETKLIKVAIRETYLLHNDGELYYKLKDGGFSDEDILMYLERKRELYTKYYEYNPDERLAQIKSHRTISDMMFSAEKQLPNICDFAQACYIEQLLAGYKYDSGVLTCPTITYFNGMEYQEDFKSFEFYSDDFNLMQNNIFNSYNMIDRFSLGLPVSIEEYDQVQKVLRNTNKYSSK